jgi:hypothetical protein
MAVPGFLHAGALVVAGALVFVPAALVPVAGATVVACRPGGDAGPYAPAPSFAGRLVLTARPGDVAWGQPVSGRVPTFQQAS